MFYTKKDSRDSPPAALKLSSNECNGVSVDAMVAQTPLSNTGLISQNGFTTGIDWLDITFRNVPDSSALRRLLSDIEGLTGDVIDFDAERQTFNGRQWTGSGRGVNGVCVWYDCAKVDTGSLVKTSDGNLLAFPGLLPVPWEPFPLAAREYVAAKLPAIAHLVETRPSRTVIDPFTGMEYPDHGYSIERSEQKIIEEPAQLKISIPGKLCRGISPNALSAWLLAVGAPYQLDCTRIDIRLDDLECFVKLDDVLSARQAGDFFDASRTKQIQSGKRGQPEGRTAYFGSRSSDKMLRVYDQEIASGGTRKGNRWEVELHRKRAFAALSAWLKAWENGAAAASRFCQNTVLGAVDFRSRSGDDPNRSRCEILPWFKRLCDRLSAIPAAIRVEVEPPTVQRSIDWVKRSVAPTVATLHSILKEDFAPFLQSLLVDGGARLSNVKRRVIEQTEREQLCY